MVSFYKKLRKFLREKGDFYGDTHTLNLTANCSILAAPSVKSLASQHQAVSEDAMGFSSISSLIRWLHATFSTCSLRCRTRNFSDKIRYMVRYGKIIRNSSWHQANPALNLLTKRIKSKKWFQKQVNTYTNTCPSWAKQRLKNSDVNLRTNTVHLLCDLWLMIFISPMPLSFHWLMAVSYL